MTLRLVLLDLDDTLLDHRGAVAVGIRGHLVASGAMSPDATAADVDAAVALWYALEEQHYHRYLAGELTYLGQRRARVRGFLAAQRSADAAEDRAEPDDAATDAWFQGYLAGYEDAWRALPGAHDALDEIQLRHPGVVFGIVTNGERPQQSAKIARAGFADRVDVVVCSHDLGFAKPDPRIFHEACREAGVDPAEAVMVGDRLRTDARGAVAAGLGGVWLDLVGDGTSPDGAPVDTLPAGVQRTTSLAELPGGVDRAHAERIRSA